MASSKIIGGSLPVNKITAVVTAGIGHPLLPVEETAASASPYILDGSSFVAQGPVALDTPYQVNYGPALNGPDDSAMIDANGNITFNEEGSYIWTVSLYVSRDKTAGVAVLFFRSLKDGVQQGNPLGYELDDADITVPAILGGVLTAVAGEVRTIEMIRDSSGVNFGGLQTLPATPAGWGSSPSARLTIRRM